MMCSICSTEPPVWGSEICRFCLTCIYPHSPLQPRESDLRFLPTVSVAISTQFAGVPPGNAPVG